MSTDGKKSGKHQDNEESKDILDELLKVDCEDTESKQSILEVASRNDEREYGESPLSGMDSIVLAD